MTSSEQLTWRCRRGTRELDMLVQYFLNNHYSVVSPDMRLAFERLLDMPDPELYDLLMRKQLTQDRDVVEIVKIIHNQFASQSK